MRKGPRTRILTTRVLHHVVDGRAIRKIRTEKRRISRDWQSNVDGFDNARRENRNKKRHCNHPNTFDVREEFLEIVLMATGGTSLLLVVGKYTYHRCYVPDDRRRIFGYNVRSYRDNAGSRLFVCLFRHFIYKQAHEK